MAYQLIEKKDIRFTNLGTVELTNLHTKEVIQYRYADFWERFLARFIDILIIALPQICIPIIPAWLYWSIQQSGDSQATIGQSAFNIKVLSIDGKRVNFGQATGRYFGVLLNILTFFIGYLMFFMNDKKQCLHDYIAGTIVVKEIGRKTIAQ